MSYPASTVPPGQQGRSAPGRTPAHVASPTDTGMIPIIRQPEAPQQQRRIASPGFGLRGPRRNRHVVSADELAAISMPIGDDGVLIGTDPDAQPAVLGLSRPTAFDVVLVGGLWLAQVLALRAAATGARVGVETGRPQVWQPLASGGRRPAVRDGLSGGTSARAGTVRLRVRWC